MGEAISEVVERSVPVRRSRPYGERLWLSRRLLVWSVRSSVIFFAAAGLIMAVSRVDRSACLRILGVDDANVRSLSGYRSLIADVDAGRIALENRFPPRREFAYLPVLGRALYTTDDGRFPPAYALILQGPSGIFSDDYVLQTRMVDAFDTEDPTDNFRRLVTDPANRTVAYLWRSPDVLSSASFGVDRLSVSDTATGETRTANLGNDSPYTYLNTISDDGAFLTIRRNDAQQTLAIWSLQTLQPYPDAPAFLTGAWVPGQPVFMGVALGPEGRSIAAWSPLTGLITKRVLPLGEPAGRAAADWKTIPAPDGRTFALQHIEPVCAGAYCPTPHFVFDIYNVGGTLISGGLRGDTLRQTAGSSSSVSPPAPVYRRSASWSSDGQVFYYVSTPDTSGTPPVTGALIALSIQSGESATIATDIRSDLTDTIFFPNMTTRYYTASTIQDATARPRVVIPVGQPDGRLAVDILNSDGTGRVRLLDDVDTIDALRNPFHYYFQGLGWAADGRTILLPWSKLSFKATSLNPSGGPNASAGVTWAAIDGSNQHTIDGLTEIDLVNIAIDQTVRRASRYFGLLTAADSTRASFRFELVNLDTARRYPVALPAGLRPRDWLTWFAPGGKYAAVTLESTARTTLTQVMAVINLETGDVQLIDSGYIAAWSMDGQRLAVGRFDAMGRQVIDILPIAGGGTARHLMPETLTEIRTLSWNPCH
jgi:hypothetical protein